MTESNFSLFHDPKTRLMDPDTLGAIILKKSEHLSIILNDILGFVIVN